MEREALVRPNGGDGGHTQRGGRLGLFECWSRAVPWSEAMGRGYAQQGGRLPRRREGRWDVESADLPQERRLIRICQLPVVLAKQAAAIE